jgi:hypothetical protein
VNESRAITIDFMAECLQALDAGRREADVLAARPGFAEELSRLLALRNRLGLRPAPEPGPAAFNAGRQALLAAVVRTPAPAGRTSWLEGVRGFAAAGFLRSPLARVAAASLAVCALAGGALGASAAAGVGQARDALSALHIVQSISSSTSVQPTPSNNAPAGDTQSAGTPVGGGSTSSTGATPEDQAAAGPSDCGAHRSDAETQRSDPTPCASAEPPASVPLGPTASDDHGGPAAHETPKPGDGSDHSATPADPHRERDSARTPDGLSTPDSERRAPSGGD